jgi:hypothetical protein
MKSGSFPILALALSIGLLGACAHEGTSKSSAETGAPQATTGAEMTSGAQTTSAEMTRSGGDCPMGVAGAGVTSASTPSGAELTFTTVGDTVDELRRRVHAMAMRFNARSSAYGHMGPPGMGPEGGMTAGAGMGRGYGGMGMGRGGMMGADAGARMGMGMVPMRADVEEIDRGARLRMVPLDATRLEELRMHTAERARIMTQQRECPIWGAP